MRRGSLFNEDTLLAEENLDTRQILDSGSSSVRRASVPRSKVTRTLVLSEIKVISRVSRKVFFFARRDFGETKERDSDVSLAGISLEIPADDTRRYYVCYQAIAQSLSKPLESTS